MRDQLKQQARPGPRARGAAGPRLLSIAGFSGAGKTTFIEKLIPQLTQLGLRVGTIKHDVHGFEMDKPGKDSWRHKRAGASTTVISSPKQIGMVTDVDHDHKPEQLLHFFPAEDIVLVEGFKRWPQPKLEIFRPEVTSEPILKTDRHLMALITDADIDIHVPVFGLDDAAGVAAFIATVFGLHPAAHSPSEGPTSTANPRGRG